MTLRRKEYLAEVVEHLDPCEEARSFLYGYTVGEEQKAWDECGNPSWMFWLLSRCAPDVGWHEGRKPIFLLAIDIVRLSDFWVEPDSKVKLHVKTLRDWAKGCKAVTQKEQEAFDYVDHHGGCTLSDAVYTIYYYKEFIFHHYVNFDKALKLIRRRFPNPPKVPPRPRARRRK